MSNELFTLDDVCDARWLVQWYYCNFHNSRVGKICVYDVRCCFFGKTYYFREEHLVAHRGTDYGSEPTNDVIDSMVALGDKFQNLPGDAQEEFCMAVCKKLGATDFDD